MNDLEQWLADVKAYNADAANIYVEGKAAEILSLGHTLEARGRKLGLKVTKIRSMLASVKLKVKLPEEPRAGT